MDLQEKINIILNQDNGFRNNKELNKRNESSSVQQRKYLEKTQINFPFCLKAKQLEINLDKSQRTDQSSRAELNRTINLEKITKLQYQNNEEIQTLNPEYQIKNFSKKYPLTNNLRLYDDLINLNKSNHSLIRDSYSHNLNNSFNQHNSSNQHSPSHFKTNSLNNNHYLVKPVQSATPTYSRGNQLKIWSQNLSSVDQNISQEKHTQAPPIGQINTILQNNQKEAISTPSQQTSQNFVLMTTNQRDDKNLYVPNSQRKQNQQQISLTLDRKVRVKNPKSKQEIIASNYIKYMRSYPFKEMQEKLRLKEQEIQMRSHYHQAATGDRKSQIERMIHSTIRNYQATIERNKSPFLRKANLNDIQGGGTENLSRYQESINFEEFSKLGNRTVLVNLNEKEKSSNFDASNLDSSFLSYRGGFIDYRNRFKYSSQEKSTTRIIPVGKKSIEYYQRFDKFSPERLLSNYSNSYDIQYASNQLHYQKTAAPSTSSVIDDHIHSERSDFNQTQFRNQFRNPSNRTLKNTGTPHQTIQTSSPNSFSRGRVGGTGGGTISSAKTTIDNEGQTIFGVFPYQPHDVRENQTIDLEKILEKEQLQSWHTENQFNQNTDIYEVDMM